MNNKYVDGIRFSIVIPLEFHRGQVEECLQGWTKGQTFPREQYEILAVGCEASLGKDMLLSVNNILGSHDRLLLYDEPHDMALCAFAAHQAKGEILFFTESHCLPEPDILSVANDALILHPEWAGFSCQSIPKTHNPLSVIEAEMYETDIRYGMEEHPWRKILDQAFVVRKESYHSAGGFDPRFGHFAEWHLAARMHHQSLAIGYVPEAKIHHYYIGDINELIEFTRDFVHGEMAYHSMFADDRLNEYFLEPDEWRTRFNWFPPLVLKTSKLALNAHVKHGQWTNVRGTVVYAFLLTQLKLRSDYGIVPFLIWAQLRFWVAKLGLYFSLIFRGEKRLIRYFFLRLISTSVQLERIHFVRKWLLDNLVGGKLPSMPPISTFL